MLWIVVLMKNLESSLDCKEIQSVHPKGDQSWVFIQRTDVEAETPIIWPPDAKSWLIWKDPDAGKDWRQEEKGTTEDEIVRWHQGLGGHEVKQTLGDGEGQGTLACCSPWVEKSWTHDWATEQQQLLLPVEAFFSPERRSQFENLKNHRNSSVDHLKPD